MQQDQESRTVSSLRDQIRKLQDRLELLYCIDFEIEIFQDPDSPSSFASAHVSHATNPECSQIHERIWAFPEAFLIVNLPDKRLKNHTMIQEIWQHHRGFREEGIEKSGSEEPLQPIPLPCFSRKAKEKVWTTQIAWSLWLTIPRVSDLYSKWHDKSESSFLGDASGEILRPYGSTELDCELPNRGLLQGKESHTRVAVDQGNRSSHIAGWPHLSKINNRRRFPWLRRIGFDDGVSIEKVLR